MLVQHFLKVVAENPTKFKRPFRPARLPRRRRRQVRNGLQLSPNGFVWTMVMLNVTMGQVTGDDRWDEWCKEPSVPPLLRDKVRNPASFL